MTHIERQRILDQHDGQSLAFLDEYLWLDREEYHERNNEYKGEKSIVHSQKRTI